MSENLKHNKMSPFFLQNKILKILRCLRRDFFNTNTTVYLNQGAETSKQQQPWEIFLHETKLHVLKHGHTV